MHIKKCTSYVRNHAAFARSILNFLNKNKAVSTTKYDNYISIKLVLFIVSFFFEEHGVFFKSTYIPLGIVYVYVLPNECATYIKKCTKHIKYFSDHAQST